MNLRPHVSCVMPTRNRRRFVPQAISCFLRQDYAPRELVIIDDGEQGADDLVPGDERIRYMRSAKPLSLGARRNLGCSASRGDVIMHWDDDTWYSACRISSQVAQLHRSAADAGVLDGLLHYQPVTGRVWRCEDPLVSPAHLHAGTLAYRRTCWQVHPFTERVDADGEFLHAIPRERVAVDDGVSLAVALLHSTGMRTVNPSDPRWRPRPFHEVGELLQGDLQFYAGLPRSAATAGDRLVPLPVTLAATFMVYDGYGSMAEYLALGMARAGAGVQIAPFRMDSVSTSAEFQQMLERSRPDATGTVLCHAWWGENLARFGSARDLFIKTVWETSRLPADWPDRLNHATAVIVPSPFNARVFRESGVRVPIEVVPEGVDPQVYQWQKRAPERGLTTLVVGVFAPRKNLREAVAAWKLAFASDSDARLILKARFQLEPYVPDDPRIRVVDANEPTRGIAHWYRQADVLLALGNEGFGLPAVEAMAAGLPVVALDAEAQADTCADAAGLILPVRPARWEPVTGPQFGPCGVRAIPDIEDAARQLRWVAEHRQEAADIGRRASAWAHEHRNVWDMGPAVVEVLERHVRAPRPLRRMFALWSPACADGGEVSLYVDQISRLRTPMRVFTRVPAFWRAQALLIQHAPGLFDQSELRREIEKARRTGMRVAITEHVVARQADAWEQEADVLVALTAAGAARLRERWRGKRVELMPVGCLPWRAARGTPSGRTIATLGTPARECGALELLRAVRDLRDVQLVVFGVPPSEDDGWWTEASRGLPVRHADTPREAEALANRLGEEADVVVLWHDESDAALTSQAARVALASGLPVLASPTSTFADVAAATLQPADLVAGLDELFSHAEARRVAVEAARRHCEEASWARLASEYETFWRTLAALPVGN